MSKSSVTPEEKKRIKKKIAKTIAEFVAVNMEEEDYVGILRALDELETHSFDLSREMAAQIAKKLTKVLGMPMKKGYPWDTFDSHTFLQGYDAIKKQRGVQRHDL